MSVNSEWAKYIPWMTTALLGGYVIYKTLHKKCCPSAEWVNKTVKKDCPKVVDKFDIEDLGDKNVYCRCWKSKEFPKCDGSHTNHNKLTGDNIGPLVIAKSS